MDDGLSQRTDSGGQLESARKTQNLFHKALSRYVNGAIFSRADALRASVFRDSTLRRHAARIISAFQDYRDCPAPPAASRQDVDVEAYRGRNPFAYRMMEYLELHLKQDLMGAYVHGSVGTYEETAYSDFDALVILAADVFESAGRLIHVADKLQRAKTIMYEFDPLQHHGWFVMVENDLRSHCEAYFPVELFRHSKSLLPKKGTRISISVRDSLDEIGGMLVSVANSVIGKIENGRFPDNLYQLKCLTSEFMLLPALYVQRKTGAGVFKKHSFEAARRDFDPAAWSAMDEVSKLRLQWDYRLPSWRRRIACSGHVLRDHFVARFAPEIPKNMRSRLTPEFYSSMHRLAVQMRDGPTR